MKLVIGDYNLSSWSMRPWLALTVAGATFDTEVIRLDRRETKEKLRAASPNGKVPALYDGDLVVWESLAICEYAAERFPAAQLWPADPRVRAVARSVSSEMHAGFAALRREHPMNLVKRTPKTPYAEARADVDAITALWNRMRATYGADGPFLFGAFTLADAMYAPIVTRIRTYAIPVDRVSEAYCAALLALPAMQEWERRAIAEVGS